MDNREKHFKDEKGIFERESYRVRSILIIPKFLRYLNYLNIYLLLLF